MAGHLAVQYANAIGLRVVGIDTGSEKEKLLSQYGAEGFIDFKKFSGEGELIKEVKRVCGGEGPHVSGAICSSRMRHRCGIDDFVPPIQAAVITSAGGAAYNEALEYLRPHGTLVAVGLPPDTYIKANVFWTVFKSLRIVGSCELMLLVVLLARRATDPVPATDVGNRQDAIEALDFAARGKVKPQIVVEPLKNLPEGKAAEGIFFRSRCRN